MTLDESKIINLISLSTKFNYPVWHIGVCKGILSNTGNNNLIHYFKTENSEIAKNIQKHFLKLGMKKGIINDVNPDRVYICKNG